MSFQPQFPGLFKDAPAVQRDLPLEAPLLPTEKQVSFARSIAARVGIPLPKAVLRDRSTLAAWIDTHKAAAPQGRFAGYPSSRQVAFAERLARLKRNPVPPECFRDRTLMSRWIDANKPR